MSAPSGQLPVPVRAVLVPGRRRRAAQHHSHVDGATVREALRDPTFWVLAATVAATVSGLLGILSVTGRVITTGLARRHGMTAITAAVFAVQATGVAALPT